MRSFSDYLSTRLPGKVRKIAVSAGLSCPNRDGTVGKGGCIFCNNEAFCPRYTDPHKSITEQIEDGIRFFAHKGRADSYLVYFQSFSNTYGETDKLILMYEEALAYPGVSGLVIATRPDCLKPDLLDYLERRFTGEASPFLLMEIGVESTKDETLRLINRGHDYACAEQAIRELGRRGIAVGVHIILGLPGESPEQMAETAAYIGRSGADGIKLQLLHVLEGTDLAEDYRQGKLHIPDLPEYLNWLKVCVSQLPPDMVIHRLTGDGAKRDLLAPLWSADKKRVLNEINRVFEARPGD